MTGQGVLQCLEPVSLLPFADELGVCVCGVLTFNVRAAYMSVSAFTMGDLKTSRGEGLGPCHVFPRREPSPTHVHSLPDPQGISKPTTEHLVPQISLLNVWPGSSLPSWYDSIGRQWQVTALD